MLAEIFMLRMEAISRARKETAPADNPRFVPITLADFNAELGWKMNAESSRAATP